jgi:LmbE family N-acetylglucosaminyl deacetylase
MSKPVAFAVAAHPDDIEFMMAGTLLLLGEAGYELHYMNVANGSCGTQIHDRDEIVRLRTEEAREAAGTLGAQFHEPLVDDLEIYYTSELVRRLTAVVREVAPTILLVQSPQDYMEDHMICQRLAVTAGFCRGMRNFASIPERPPVSEEVTVYHAMPYGLRDGMRRVVQPGQYVDITDVLDKKRAALACHRTQKDWLDASQGLDSYLHTMEDMSREVGQMSGRFKYAEGWRRHLHLGFCAPDADPLSDALGARVVLSEEYEEGLRRG